MSKDPSQPFESIPLLTITEEGRVPEARLKDPDAARQIYQKMKDEDLIRSRHRAQTQELLDGELPWDQAILDAEGMSDMPNLNFGGAEQQLERARMPYYNAIQSTEQLVSVKTTFGPAEERDNWNAIMAEEITRTFRRWPGFCFQADKLTHHFVWEGVAFASWRDSTDWRFRAYSLDNFLIPSGAFATEDEVELFSGMDDYSVTRLYAAIENEEQATALGWNVPAVKTAIMKADSTYQANDWAYIVEKIKGNDMLMASTLPSIKVIQTIVQEFDGTVSHYLTTQTDQGHKDFLYCCRQKYDCMSEAVIMFTYGIGTNTKTHSIRGLGYKIYTFEHQRNRSLCRMISSGDMASLMMLQPDGEESMSNVGLQVFGQNGIIDPNMKAFNYTAPNITQSVLPVLNEMERLRNDRVAGYSSDNVFDGDARKTKGEVMAHLQQAATLSSSSEDFWYNPFERLIRQCVRRLTRRGYLTVEPGGREVAALKKRLFKRGVPLEAFYMLDIDETALVRSIGSGSAAAKTVALNRVETLYPRMDAIGQAKLNRDLAVDAVGVQKANEYFPLDGQKRMPVDYSIAILQNDQLLRGVEVPVLPEDYHVVHAEAHLVPLQQAFDAVQQGEVPIDQMAMQNRLLFQHTTEHVSLIQGDPATIEKAAMFRQMLQQIGEVISNGLMKAQAAANKAKEEGQQEGPDGLPAPMGPTVEEIKALEQHRARMQQAQELFNLKKSQMVETAQLKNSLADANEAAKIARQSLIKP